MEVVRHAQPRAWLSEGALAPLAIKYQAFLAQRRYAPQTQHIYLCCVAHFAHWLASVSPSTLQVDKAAIDRFLEEHLPQCTCSRPARRVQRDHRSALRLLLRLLQGGAQPPPLDETDYIGQELRRFDLYMMQVKGLAPSTRRRRVRFVARFLGEQFGARPIVAQQIKAKDLRRFMIARHHCAAIFASALWSAIRCSILPLPFRRLPTGAMRPCHARFLRVTSFSFFDHSIGRLHPASAPTRWPVASRTSACVPTRWPGCFSRTSIGTTASSESPATNHAALTSCHCH